MLFVQGTRDSFAQPALLAGVLTARARVPSWSRSRAATMGSRGPGPAATGAAIGASLAPPAAAFVERVVAGSG